MKYQAIIIGSGPSGLMAAIELEKENISYIILEKNETVARKLFISGGKRCNVTNNLDSDTFIENLTLRNKRFLYPSLYTFGPSQVVDFFRRNGLELQLENNFKYFPSTNKSQSVIDVLLKNTNPKHIMTNQTVLDVNKENDVFAICTTSNKYITENLIIATGSKSFPSTGSDGFGLKVAKAMGIEYQEFTPAETHVYSNQVVDEYPDLQGTAITNTTVRIRNTKIKHKGDLLFTHFGVSGPVIYHLSEYIYEESLKGDVFLEFPLTTRTDKEIDELFLDNNITLLKLLESLVTKRLARKIIEVSGLTNRKLSEISNRDKDKIKSILLRFTLKVTKVEEKEKAYVNKGGVVLKELNPHSLESKKVPGLYFVGETMNIHGPIGGYNITIAFATGKLAAIDIAQKYKN